jgi:16S rRNA (cytosine1402-N4)-methyltransferase
VKHGFRNDERLQVITKRPVMAGEKEREVNPRARSAKLRCAMLKEESNEKRGN